MSNLKKDYLVSLIITLIIAAIISFIIVADKYSITYRLNNSNDTISYINISKSIEESKQNNLYKHSYTLSGKICDTAKRFNIDKEIWVESTQEKHYYIPSQNSKRIHLHDTIIGCYLIHFKRNDEDSFKHHFCIETTSNDTLLSGFPWNNYFKEIDTIPDTLQITLQDNFYLYKGELWMEKE